MIKKFKNGNIRIQFKDNKYYKYSGENLYYNFVNMETLYIEFLNDGYFYIIDYSTRLIYDLPHNHVEMFLEGLERGTKYQLEPYSKKLSNEILQDNNL